MKPTLELSPTVAAGVTSCPVAAFGIVRAGPDLVASLRRNPVPAPGQPLAGPLLKHADDQTVLALAAVYQSIYNHGLAKVDFTRWGVVAAPCFLGRATLAHALRRFALEGAWGVSPHLIPHHSIHAVSGTISQALAIHGPNFGVAGGPGGAVEALILGATLISDHSLPGLWLVITEHDPEFIPVESSHPPAHSGANGKCASGPVGIALALALVRDPLTSIGISLDICPQAGPCQENGHALWSQWTPLGAVRPLADALAADGTPTGKWRLGLHGWLELTSNGGAEK